MRLHSHQMVQCYNYCFWGWSRQTKVRSSTLNFKMCEAIGFRVTTAPDTRDGGRKHHLFHQRRLQKIVQQGKKLPGKRLFQYLSAVGTTRVMKPIREGRRNRIATRTVAQYNSHGCVTLNLRLPFPFELLLGGHFTTSVARFLP